MATIKLGVKNEKLDTSSKTTKALPPAKTKAATSTTKPKNGAPATYTQGSRKGKRAWRKNVDIGEVEMGLEEMRAEERVVG